MSRTLGVDLGEARIGLALSDDLGMLASPWRTLAAGGNPVAEVAAAAREASAEVVVVGLPRNMDGSSGPAAAKARAFAGELAATGLKVELWDERLTTVAAERALRASGRRARDQRQIIDQVAAQILLQSWLDRPGAPCA